MIEESQGIYLVNERASFELRAQAVVLDSLEDCLAGAKVVVITTLDPVFKDLRQAIFKGKIPS